jgi:hypothetical protein
MSGDFAAALEHYNLVDRSAGLHQELVARMKEYALAGNKNAVKLPPHIVESIFVSQGLGKAS